LAAFVGLLRDVSVRAVVVNTGAVRLRPSAQLCQNKTIGLAINTEEYVPTRMPQTKANENECKTGPPQMNRAITVRNVRPEVMIVRLRV